MAGYLDQYGAGDEQRARKIKITILSVISGAVASCLLYFIFHNFSEEQQAKKFFELLEARNYQAAYELWGCTSAHPCDGLSAEALTRPNVISPASARIQTTGCYFFRGGPKIGFAVCPAPRIQRTARLGVKQ